MSKTYLASLALALIATASVSLLGCDQRKRPPPGSPEQIAKETRFLKQHFEFGECFQKAREGAALAQYDPKRKYLYTVQVGMGDDVDDALSYTVFVQEQDRKAFVIKSGGIMGMGAFLGPVALSACLEPTF